MRSHSIALIIVTVMLVVTAPQGFGAARERMIGPPQTNYEAVLVSLETDAATGAEITAFFWAREERCKVPERAAVLILSERLINAPEAQVRPLAEKGVQAIRRYCLSLSRPFTHGTIAVLVRPPSVTINANGQLQPGGTKLIVDIEFDALRRRKEGQKKGNIAEVDQDTGTQFTLIDVRGLGPCDSVLSVRGDVPPHINLTSEATAVALLEKGKAFALRACRSQPIHIGVTLYQGDTRMAATKFDSSTNPRYAFTKRLHGHFDNFYHKATSDLAQAQERQRQAEAQAAQQAQQQQEAARREAEARRAREQQAAIEKEKQRVQNRIDRINTENGVQAWPGIEPLMANPFVYKGKVIAIAVTFQHMTSSTDGAFDAGKGALVVSDIPEGLLVSPGRTIVVGVVLGQTEVSVPIVGKILAPHLKYVDIFKCSTGDLPCKEVLDKKFQ